ncbi:MAG: hypothetical protein K0V04_19020, partial [Deltaproteobacteria bacterium]|nr:hypothetical protein [Deltaproteobacteria bacterium]
VTNEGSVYVFDLTTDTFDYELPHGGALHNTTLAGFDHQGRLLGLRLAAGGAMEVLTIDLGTGAVSTVGQFGGLHGWYPEAVLSPDRTALYLVGSNSDDVTNEGSVYVFDLTTDTLDYELPHGGALHNTTLAGLDHQGRLLGLRLSAGGVMDVLTIDLGTGVVSTVGQFGGLYGWYPEASLSPDRKALYLVGSNSDDVTNEGSVYVFDLTTDTFDYELPHGGALHNATLAGFGE